MTVLLLSTKSNIAQKCWAGLSELFKYFYDFWMIDDENAQHFILWHYLLRVLLYVADSYWQSLFTYIYPLEIEYLITIDIHLHDQLKLNFKLFKNTRSDYFYKFKCALNSHIYDYSTRGEKETETCFNREFASNFILVPIATFIDYHTFINIWKKYSVIV